MWAWWVLFNIGGIIDVMIFIEILFNLQLISLEHLPFMYIKKIRHGYLKHSLM